MLLKEKDDIWNPLPYSNILKFDFITYSILILSLLRLTKYNHYEFPNSNLSFVIVYHISLLSSLVSIVCFPVVICKWNKARSGLKFFYNVKISIRHFMNSQRHYFFIRVTLKQCSKEFLRLFFISLRKPEIKMMYYIWIPSEAQR